MGLGDDLMITGFVEQEKNKHQNKQIVIGNLQEKMRSSSLNWAKTRNRRQQNALDHSLKINAQYNRFKENQAMEHQDFIHRTVSTICFKEQEFRSTSLAVLSVSN